MTLQQEEQAYMQLLDSEGCCGNSIPLTISELDESIGEIQAMLAYSIDISDQNEIKAWRRMLQQAKIQRRELLAS